MKKNSEINLYNLILLLGGKSSRFDGGINKVYCLINNRPLFLYSLDAFLQFKEITKIIIVYNKNDENLLKEYVKDYKDVVLTEGGEERYLSVCKGLQFCTNEYTIVHDGARPNISHDIIQKALEESKKYDALSVGVKVTDTIKKVTNNCFETCNRDNLYIMQTPQITKTDLLRECLNKVKKDDHITDDLMAIEKYSSVVPHITIGEKNNFKITSISDYQLMKVLLENKNV